MKSTKHLFVLPLILSLIISTQVKSQESNNDDKSQIFEVIEQMPEYPGGSNALIKFIGENIKYPQSAIEANITGTVVVRFVVNKQGNVERAEVMRSVHASLDAEALRVVNMLNGWSPGKQKGQNVNVWYSIPIRFQLPDSKPERKILILIDGVAIPSCIDAKQLPLADFRVEILRAETPAIRASLIEKFGPEAEGGVAILTSKDLKKTKKLFVRLNIPTNLLEENIIYEVVDKAAQFPGGNDAMMNFLNLNIKYPQEAIDMLYSDTVIVQFVVSNTGKIVKPAIKAGKYLPLNKEAIRVISAMPNWIPAVKDGENVSSYYSLPVRFKLDTNSDF